MPSIDYANLTYLIVLGLALSIWFFMEHRQNIGRSLRQGAAWGLIFLGAIAAYGLWGDIRQTVAPQQSVFSERGEITLPRAPDGHYYATLDVNGAKVQFVVDTGATGVVLTQADARKAGLNTEDLVFFSSAMTANGEVRTAPISLDAVKIGPFTDSAVPAFVNSGEMDKSLLGMSYLQRFDRIEISNGQLILQR